MNEMRWFDKFFPLLLVIGIAINFNGLFIEILEPDGALYATIAKHIAITGDWINLWGDGHDWLDKPHLPFWICAASFKILGINAFAYKLPAFLFWLVGVGFTYRLAYNLYNNSVAKIAVVIYLYALHSTLNNFDVRAEPFLTTLSIAAIYYFYKAHTKGNWLYIVLTAFLSACAIMTKGIFILITIGFGFIIWWIISKQYWQFVNYKWYVMMALIVVFITPELYCLYQQFDLHPEKTVFGKTNVSGLRFFLWDSQFGRFFNTGPIKGKGDKTFFIHTTLWAFLPWSIILFTAVINVVRKKTQQGAQHYERWIIYGSSLITFILFSFSGFQLPHYITLLFPHFSIITAFYLFSLFEHKCLKILKWIQIVLLIIAGIAVTLLSRYAVMGFSYSLLIGIWLFIIATIYFSANNSMSTIIKNGCALSIVVFIYLFNFFYPSLLQYQSGMLAGKWIKENKPSTPSALFNSFSYSFEFYAPGYVETLKTNEQLEIFLQKNPSAILYTSAIAAQTLKQQGYNVQVHNNYNYFAVSMLEAGFLNTVTRENHLEKMCIISVSR